MKLYNVALTFKEIQSVQKLMDKYQTSDGTPLTESEYNAVDSARRTMWSAFYEREKLEKAGARGRSIPGPATHEEPKVS